jgi:ABC-type transport system involved in cytochrome bd biosynthesis fused ATPase/permease subunit
LTEATPAGLGTYARAPELRPSIVTAGEPPATPERITLSARQVSAWYGPKLAVSDVSLEVEANSVTALIGPSAASPH